MRQGTLVFLQPPGTASQFLSVVLHQHQALVKPCSLKRNILLGLRTPVYKSLEEAGAVSDHPGFIRLEKLTPVLSLQDRLEAWRTFLHTSEVLPAGASQEIVLEIPDFILSEEKKCRWRPEPHGKKCEHRGFKSGSETTQPCNGTNLQLIFSPPSLYQAEMPDANLSCGFYLQPAALGSAPLSLLPQTGLGSLDRAIPPLRAAGNIFCTGRLSYCSCGVMPCGNLSHPAIFYPNTGSSEVNKLVSIKSLMSQNKDYALHKNKTRWFPRGQKIFVTRKSIATCQLPIPSIFMHPSKLLTLHTRKYCSRINLLWGDTLNINSEPRVNTHRQDIKLWKQDLIMVMLTKPLLQQW